MKKALILLLCAASILFLTASALGESNDTTLAADNTGFGMIQSACELKGAVCFLSGKGIYRWTPGPGSPEKLTDLSLIQGFSLSPTKPKSPVERELWEQGMSCLFTDGEALYGLHPYTGQVFVLQGEIMAPLVRIPQDQYFYTDQENLLPKEIKILVFANRKLYLMLMSFTAKQGDTRELFSWDLHSDAMQLLNAPGAQAVFPGPKGGLLVRVSPEKEQAQDQTNQPRPTLWLYEPASQAYTQMVWDEAVSSAADCVWREEDGSLYFLNEGGKVVKALPGGKTQVKAYLPISFADADSQAFLLENGAYVYIKAGSLFVRDISQNGEKQAKTVHVARYMDPSITIAFSVKHPDISLILDSDVTDFLSIQQSMVSGNSDIDLYIVNSADAYQDIREKGYAAPMNGNALLLEKRSSYIRSSGTRFLRGTNCWPFP